MADAGAVKRLLAAEDDLFPIIDTNGRALAGVWIGEFERANLGPHMELQISLFATPGKMPKPVPSHPFSTIRAMLALPETVMVCHGLWNTTNRVVAYNRDNLALDAQWSAGTLSQSHMQWIGFIAGTTNLAIQITPNNCNFGRGLEVGLYETSNCTNFKLISNCDTDIRENEAAILRNTAPLVVGQYYFFVMDGNGNDICNWTIKVLEGSTKVSPLDTAPEIILPTTICQNESFDVKTPGLTGATYYQWTIDGENIKNSLSFVHKLEKPGEYNICLNASNVCDQAPQACKN